jgi:methyl-accepting chemotaxis protein
MKTATLRRRITLGFGLLVLITATLGTGVAWTMLIGREDAARLSEQYVPETHLASQLQDAVARAEFAAHSYLLTGHDSYLEAATKDLETIGALSAKAQSLAETFPHLTKLRETLEHLRSGLATFDQGLHESRENLQEIAEARRMLDEAAATFVKCLDYLMAGQEKRLKEEIAAHLDASQLERRLQKSMLAQDLYASGNLVRIEVMKALSSRDPDALGRTTASFGEINRIGEELSAILVIQEDLAELTGALEATNLYRQEIEHLQKLLLANQAHDEEQSQLAAELEKAASELAAVGLERTADAAHHASLFLARGLAGTALGIAMALLASLAAGGLIIRQSTRILRRISQSIQHGAAEGAVAANQVAHASTFLAETTSEQASALEETSSSLEELSSMTRRNSENAHKARLTAREALQSSEMGTQKMARMQSTMGTLQNRSAEIEKVIKTIDEIAFQTNLLALNAAVEAARAGEAGAGFSVVAEEVRALAQRSAVAARETTDNIGATLSLSNEGARLSAEVSAALSEITEKVKQVETFSNDIADASREQSEGVEQINQAINQIDQATQQGAAFAEETSAAAEEMNQQASSLRRVVDELAAFAGEQVSLHESVSEPVSRPSPALSAKRFPGSSGSGSATSHPPGDSSYAAAQPAVYF